MKLKELYLEFLKKNKVVVPDPRFLMKLEGILERIGRIRNIQTSKGRKGFQRKA